MLFSLLVLSVLLALSALPCLPIVCAKPKIKRKVELNSLEFPNSCFDALACLMLAHVMSAVASDIEASERLRARAPAGAMLQPARIIGKRRCRAARPSESLSCLRDSILACAYRFHLSSLIADLSVVRRDVVRAGFIASRRAHCNFDVMERILRRHHANVLILSKMDVNVVQHALGDISGKCIGTLYWNINTRHVSEVPMLPFTFDTNTTPPWFSSVVGGKRPKAKAKPKSAKKRHRSDRKFC